MYKFLRHKFAKLQIKRRLTNRRELKNLCQCLKHYNVFCQIPSTSTSKEKISILCFGYEVAWSNLLSQELKNDCLGIKTANMCNEQIASNIVNYCNIYKPKSIYVLFSDLFILPDYTTSELTSISYDYIQELNNLSHYTPLGQMSKFYLQEYSGVNLFLRFVRIFKYIETYCNTHNIKFYWYSQSRLIQLLPYDQIKKYLNINTILTGNMRLKSLNKDLFQKQLAENFAKKTYDKATIFS